MSCNIVLIGAMGAGKTTMGRRLSKSLSKPFIDIDEEIELTLGVSIQTIFDKEGEKGFRKREKKILSEVLCQVNNHVIATGGGCILTEGCRKILMQQHLVIHLDVTIHQQHQRLKQDNKRPILKQGDLKDKLTKLREQRNDIYHAIADISVLSDNLNYNSLLNKIKTYEKNSHLP